MTSNADLTPRTGAVCIWVVYDHPSDHPDFFVVRPWDIVGGQYFPRSRCALFRDLDKARAWCAQFGAVRLERHTHDDPTILETWM